jgi:hypothetical protein
MSAPNIAARVRRALAWVAVVAVCAAAILAGAYQGWL